MLLHRAFMPFLCFCLIYLRIYLFIFCRYFLGTAAAPAPRATGSIPHHHSDVETEFLVRAHFCNLLTFARCSALLHCVVSVIVFDIVRPCHHLRLRFYHKMRVRLRFDERVAFYVVMFDVMDRKQNVSSCSRVGEAAKFGVFVRGSRGCSRWPFLERATRWGSQDLV